MPARGLLPRIPLLRNFVPRVSALGKPILPFTSLANADTAFLTGASRTQSRLFSNFHARLTAKPSSPSRANSESNPESESDPYTLPPNSTLSQRLKHLIKSYGWYALGVYFLLSAFDFSLAFASINLLGASYVAHLTASIKTYIHTVLPALSAPAEPGRDEMDSPSSAAAHNGGGGGQESLYAMLLLAYTVHKTLFFPFRIGVTAAVTPRLVGWLRMRGWAGGEGAKRAARQMRERVRRPSRDRD